MDLQDVPAFLYEGHSLLQGFFLTFLPSSPFESQGVPLPSLEQLESSRQAFGEQSAGCVAVGSLH